MHSAKATLQVPEVSLPLEPLPAFDPGRVTGPLPEFDPPASFVSDDTAVVVDVCDALGELLPQAPSTSAKLPSPTSATPILLGWDKR
jgi:hypothetical protein